MTDEPAPRYAIELSGSAEADIDSHIFYLLGISPDLAGTWEQDLRRTLDSLEVFPRRCPAAPEGSVFGRDVRQLLFGRGKNMCRVFFVVRDEPGEHPPAVRILRVIHASRRLSDQSDEP